MYISEFKIDNFRSLAGVHLEKMQPVCIFHGENNSGKSNILAALDLILKAKAEEIPTPAGQEQGFTRATPFYRGQLGGFSDNFRFGSVEPISFEISIRLADIELLEYHDILEQLPAPQRSKGEKTQAEKLTFGEDGHKTITVNGQLRYVNGNVCEAFTSWMRIDDEFTLYQNTGDNPEFLPALAESAVPFDARAQVVDGIAALLTDGFQLIGADRAIGSEKVAIAGLPPLFDNASSFKRSLFNLSTNRGTHSIFKEIIRRFNDKPFSFGEIGFAIDPSSEALEIMIERSGIRLPINRVGSGMQQILFLLSNILYRQTKMIGVEEIELNLSPRGQKTMFNTIRSLVYDAKLITQALLTSHSPYSEDHKNVAYFKVAYDPIGLRTSVMLSDKNERETFFSSSGGWEPDDW